MYMVFGLEIECLIKSNLDIPRGRYHAGYKITNNWETQDDSSVSCITDYESSNYSAYELVSLRPFKRCELNKVLGELMNYLDADFGTGIKVNSSCGAHIHFSIMRSANDEEREELGIAHRNLQLYREVPDKFLIAVGDEVRSRLGKEEKEDNFRAFQKQYYRAHAEPIRPEARDYERRNREFWFSDKGIEYRSFNLLGCENWGQVLNRYMATLEILEDEFLSELGRPEPFSSYYKVRELGIINPNKRLNHAKAWFNRNKVIALDCELEKMLKHLKRYTNLNPIECTEAKRESRKQIVKLERSEEREGELKINGIPITIWELPREVLLNV